MLPAFASRQRKRSVTSQVTLRSRASASNTKGHPSGWPSQFAKARRYCFGGVVVVGFGVVVAGAAVAGLAAGVIAVPAGFEAVPVEEAPLRAGAGTPDTAL